MLRRTSAASLQYLQAHLNVLQKRTGPFKLILCLHIRAVIQLLDGCCLDAFTRCPFFGLHLHKVAMRLALTQDDMLCSMTIFTDLSLPLYSCDPRESDTTTIFVGCCDKWSS